MVLNQPNSGEEEGACSSADNRYPGLVFAKQEESDLVAGDRFIRSGDPINQGWSLENPDKGPIVFERQILPDGRVGNVAIGYYTNEEGIIEDAEGLDFYNKYADSDSMSRCEICVLDQTNAERITAIGERAGEGRISGESLMNDRQGSIRNALDSQRKTFQERLDAVRVGDDMSA